MPIFDKQDLQELSLPVTNGRIADLLREQKLDLLLACVYPDGFLIKSDCLFLKPAISQETEKQGVWTFVMPRNHATMPGQQQEMLVFHEWIITQKTSFFLNGKLLRKGKNFLVGIFSYDPRAQCEGYIWASDLIKKCVPL
jgi:hypothetical protein